MIHTCILIHTYNTVHDKSNLPVYTLRPHSVPPILYPHGCTYGSYYCTQIFYFVNFSMVQNLLLHSSTQTCAFCKIFFDTLRYSTPSLCRQYYNIIMSACMFYPFIKLFSLKKFKYGCILLYAVRLYALNVNDACISTCMRTADK